MIFRSFITGIICCITTLVFSQQEYVQFLPSSQQVTMQKSNTAFYNSSLISLPFFDDFAYPSSLPIPQLWADNYGFVNTSFGKNPITAGVLTLDAVNQHGKLYANASTFPSVSDYVTSQPINLATYKPVFASDKLYVKVSGDFELLDDEYFLFDVTSNSYKSIVSGLLYQAGDTLYHKQGNDYVVFQDSIYAHNGAYTYIEGSYAFAFDERQYSLLDNIALSFYYQSGGFANKPNETDSLVVEFYVPHQVQGIFINEIAHDWIEIYNATDTIVSLQNWFVCTDTLANVINQNVLHQFQISQNIDIYPYSHGLISAKSIGLESFETAVLFLYSPDTIGIDSVAIQTFPIVSQVYARIPDGNPQWSYSMQESPGVCNPLWNRVWASNKDTGDYFDFAYIPITKQAYLQKGFRFRFKNYTSLSNDLSHARNEDFWNIDMVWLDAHRSPQQAQIPDVAFTQSLLPLYHSYRSIPFSHFSKIKPIDFRLTIDSKIANFDAEYRKAYMQFAVKKMHVNERISFHTFLTDLPPYTQSNEKDNLLAHNIAFFDFMTNDIGLYERAEYEFQYFFTDNNNPIYSQYRWNDTIRVSLSMDNYYAYDDGVPEAGYGLRNAPMGKVAYRYDVLQADTLKAIDIYFNPTLVSAPPIFNLCVWAVNDKGLPGELLYYMPTQKVLYASGLYNFSTYQIFPEGIIGEEKNGIFIEKGFFVGWEQPYDVLLNVGLDLSSNFTKKIYYNVGLQWTQSLQTGSLMIRPVFGKLSQAQDILDLHTNNKIIVYPSIVSSRLCVSDPSHVVSSYKIFDMNAHMIVHNQYHDECIDVSFLKSGVYSIQLLYNARVLTHQMFVITK